MDHLDEPFNWLADTSLTPVMDMYAYPPPPPHAMGMYSGGHMPHPHMVVPHAQMALAPESEPSSRSGPIDAKTHKRKQANRDSARECRRKKKEHVTELEARVEELTRENLELKLKLKLGKDAQIKEESEKEQMTTVLEQMLEGGDESAMTRMIEEFTDKYADYGRNRRSSVKYHLEQLDMLLRPTQVTKMVMWSLQQKDLSQVAAEVAAARESSKRKKAAAAARRNAAAANAAAAAAVAAEGGSSLQSGGPNGIGVAGSGGGSADGSADGSVTGDSGSASDSEGEDSSSKRRRTLEESVEGGFPGARATGETTLWGVLIKELELTSEQVQNLVDVRETIQSLCNELSDSLKMLHELRHQVNRKNLNLDKSMSEVQKVLTPQQSIKFIMWVHRNPACMHMLNYLWKM